MPLLILLFFFLACSLLNTVFLVQPFITYPTNDKKTAESSHPWVNVFLVFVEN